MENKDQPAFAQFIADVKIMAAVANKGIDLQGLTKREYFAAMAMQGMLAAGYGDFKDVHQDYISKMAISQADELLKQLSQ